VIIAPTISARPPDDPILDWAALVDEGRASLAAMSDGRWTDFNVHDPGITILELVAYALTDLGYRTRHPMADLLAGSAPLAGPADSLTTRAVTLDDMRRLGLDVEGVRNVWIEPGVAPGVMLRHTPGAGDLSFDPDAPGNAEPVALTGVHRVLIEKSSREDWASADVARAVAQRLHAERNLGEDFEAFIVLDPQPVVVAADIEIDDPAHAEAILLDLFARLDTYVSPEVPRVAVAALRTQGLSSDVIYDGPALNRGVTAGPADPDGRRRVLHLSDVIAVLAAATGVRAPRRVRIGGSIDETDVPGIAWSLPVGDGQTPNIDLRASRIRLLIGGAVALDSTQRPDLVQLYADGLRAQAATAAAIMADTPVPVGRDRRLADYLPLRFELPGTYGVRPGSLSSQASPERKAAANQLRAYLMMIDALLASSFAQLSGVGSLLSVDGSGRSYFAEIPDALAGEAPLLPGGFNADILQGLVEPVGSPGARDRRNRFLGHLLARVGESVPAVPRPPGQDPGADSAATMQALESVRTEFLTGFTRLSAGRGAGANLLVTGDASPLIERIRLKLGLPPEAATRMRLVEHILLRGVADDQGEAQPLLAAAARADPYSLQLSFVLDATLKPIDGDLDSITRVIRDETPAHLVTYVRWLAPADFDSFATAHDRWLLALRHYRRETIGITEPA
jgi:hypothetical protein